MITGCYLLFKKIAADDILFFYFYLSKKIRLNVSSESSAGLDVSSESSAQQRSYFL